MKIQNVSYLRRGAALVFGLLVAWHVSMPSQASLNNVVARGGHYCEHDNRVVDCGSHTGDPEDCDSTFNACKYDKTETKQCTENGGGSPHNCLSDPDCYQLRNDLCAA